MTKQTSEKCKRCGEPYKIPGISICPCSHIFSEPWGEGGGYIEFKDEENQKKCMALIQELLTTAKQEWRESVVEKLEGMKEDEWRAPNAMIRNQALDDIKEALNDTK